MNAVAPIAPIAPVAITNASRSRAEIPDCIARREPEAVFAWFSNRRFQVVKGGEALSLSADDLRSLFRFVDANRIEEQL